MHRGRFNRVALALFVLVVVLVGLRLWPKPELRDRLGSSTPVYARHGELLRLTLAHDQQYRLWTPLDQISPSLVQSTLLYEDRAFWWHPGINPAAIARSAVHMMQGGRREGASTISMQLARRLERMDSRSIKGKLLQAWTALVLELRYSKRDILEAYLNSTPYGGNIEGIGTASLIYFNHDASSLTMSESLTLAVIPQNPAQRLPTRYSTEDSIITELEAARGRLWSQWKKIHPEQAASHDADALMRPVALTRSSLPFLAPHLTDMLLSTGRGARARQQTANVIESDGAIHTTLDLPMQLTLERIMKHYLASRAESGLSNASALLLDASTMEVRALVGSADYGDASLQGQFNGTQGKRSPGSTLKPFIYALALDQGLLHPRTILKDSPVSFAGFSPENYDGQFVGPVSAQDALIRSRNIPAVSLAAKLNRPNLHQFLQLNKISRLKSEAHYGLALALGGGEVTPEELARLYAVLANGGVSRPLKYVRNDLPSKASEHLDSGASSNAQTDSGALNPVSNDKNVFSLLSPAAAFITLDMLRQTPRPDTLAPAQPPIAWKTGTSWSYRDAWTAGVFGRHVLVVWVGDFSGKSHPAFVGIDAAAPLFLRMVDALRAQGQAPGDIVRPRPDDLQQVEVCAATGDLPDGVCPVKVKTWFIAGKSPIQISQLHESVQIDQKTGQVICDDAAAKSPSQESRTILLERWGSDMQRIFEQSGLPRRQLDDAACEQNTLSPLTAMAPSMRSPQRGVRYVVGPNSDPLTLRADAASGIKTLYWFADDSLLGQSAPGESITWRPPSHGHYLLRVVDDLGRVDIRELHIDDPLSQAPALRLSN